MTAPSRSPRLTVSATSWFGRRGWKFSCPGCDGTPAARLRFPTNSLPAAHNAATEHAKECTPLLLQQLRHDVRDQALLLRMRATHLESTSRDTGELPFPWVELRSAARQLDELVAST